MRNIFSVGYYNRGGGNEVDCTNSAQKLFVFSKALFSFIIINLRKNNKELKMKKLLVIISLFVLFSSLIMGENLSILVNGNNQTAIDLYGKLSHKNKENIFFSPFSISTAFGMTFAGARGKTENEMAKVLHFTLPQKKLHPAFSILIEKINAKNKLYKLNIANALWGQKDYNFLKEFKKLIYKYYSGGFYEVNFKTDTEGARKKINTWVEEKTNRKIKELISKRDINDLTRLVLTNAIYFKGKWASKFDEKNTKPAPFYTSSDKKIEISMMYREDNYPYYGNENLQVLELPYVGDDLSMVVFLPAEKSGLSGLEKELTLKKLELWISKMYKRKVRVYFPRFKAKTKYYLVEILSSMGMSDTFSNKADLSGMTGHKELKISKVIHQAYIDVNEEGTEASASTAIVMTRKALPRPSPVFKANHPFLFLIVHKKTKSILFMGRIINPIK